MIEPTSEVQVRISLSLAFLILGKDPRSMKVLAGVLQVGSHGAMGSEFASASSHLSF